MPKRKLHPELNKRLDEFLTNLDIEEDKKRRIVEYFENLTFEQLKRQSR